MSREAHVPFCEGLQGRFLRSTLLCMAEDACQIYQDHGAENWAMLRQAALNMLRSEPSKGSIPAKQKRAWMKTAYLEAVLSAGFSYVAN